MIAGNVVTIRHASDDLSYGGAKRLARNATAAVERGWTVRLDLSRADHATTAALARLVVLRRELRKTGRDLCIAGLHGQPKRVFDVSRIGELLPIEETAAVAR